MSDLVDATALSELADPGKLTHADKPHGSLMLKLHDFLGKKRELARKPKADFGPCIFILFPFIMEVKIREVKSV